MHVTWDRRALPDPPQGPLLPSPAVPASLPPASLPAGQGPELRSCLQPPFRAPSNQGAPHDSKEGLLARSPGTRGATPVLTEPLRDSGGSSCPYRTSQGFGGPLPSLQNFSGFLTPTDLIGPRAAGSHAQLFAGALLWVWCQASSRCPPHPLRPLLLQPYCTRWEPLAPGPCTPLSAAPGPLSAAVTWVSQEQPPRSDPKTWWMITASHSSAALGPKANHGNSRPHLQRGVPPHWAPVSPVPGITAPSKWCAYTGPRRGICSRREPKLRYTCPGPLGKQELSLSWPCFRPLVSHPSSGVTVPRCSGVPQVLSSLISHIQSVSKTDQPELPSAPQICPPAPSAAGVPGLRLA